MDLRNLANALKERLMPEREQSVFGMQDAYKQHVLDAQMNNEAPLEFKDFVRMQQMRNTPVQQAPRPQQMPAIDFFKR